MEQTFIPWSVRTPTMEQIGKNFEQLLRECLEKLILLPDYSM
jgi:hypothetical protein